VSHHLQLLRLAEEYVFLPVARKKSGPGGTEQISVPTIFENALALVPTFTSEDLFSAWSNGRFHCLSLIGADIVAAVPAGAGIIVDPGSPQSYQLNAQELEKLAELDLPTFVDDEPAVRPEISAELHSALSSLMSRHPSVSEAYLTFGDGNSAEFLLGLLYRSVSPGDRFNLLSEIADIASSQLGEISAIEVYDDLYLSHSGSWILFNALTPFYVAEQASINEHSPLVAQATSLRKEIEQVPEAPNASPNVSLKPPPAKPFLSRIFVRG